MPLGSKSSFYQDIYHMVSKIPVGCVATYGQIARLVGHPRAARQVGYAMARAPKEQCLPCHRVVNRLGELAPEHAFGDKALQRMLLESEGITFLADGRIDLAQHIWRTEQQQG